MRQRGRKLAGKRSGPATSNTQTKTFFSQKLATPLKKAFGVLLRSLVFLGGLLFFERSLVTATNDRIPSGEFDSEIPKDEKWGNLMDSFSSEYTSFLVENLN